MLRGRRHVVPLGGGERDDLHLFQAQFLLQRPDLLPDGLEDLPTIARQVHLVDGEHEIPDPHQGADPGVTAGLDEHALRRVHQDHRQIRERRPHRHVPRVLLVSRRVRHDEAPRLRGEVAVGHVDRDALLPFRHEAVQEEGVVHLPAPGPRPAVQFQGLFLIRVEQFRVIEDVADEGGLPVVHTAAGDEPQQRAPGGGARRPGRALPAVHQKYPSRLRFSMLASPPSRSMIRLVRSDVTAPSVSRMTASRVSASDSTPPVRG